MKIQSPKNRNSIPPAIPLLDSLLIIPPVFLTVPTVLFSVRFRWLRHPDLLRGFDYKRTGGGGAVPMIDDGCLDGVDEIYGWHNWPAFPLGRLAVRAGPAMPIVAQCSATPASVAACSAIPLWVTFERGRQRGLP